MHGQVGLELNRMPTIAAFAIISFCCKDFKGELTELTDLLPYAMMVLSEWFFYLLVYPGGSDG